MHAIALAEVDSYPMSVRSSQSVRAGWMKGGGFVLRHGLHLAEHFAAGCLIKLDRPTGHAHRFQHTRDAERGILAGGNWLLKRSSDEGHRRQIVNLIRMRALQRLHKGHLVE